MSCTGSRQGSTGATASDLPAEAARSRTPTTTGDPTVPGADFPRSVFTTLASICRQPRSRTVAVVVCFCLLAFAAYWPIYPGDPSRLPTCACGDTAQSVWFLRWMPFALLHGHNPLFTSWINAPVGANLAQNILMVSLGVVASPMTLLAGPTASFNLFAWMAFPLSASAMFVLAKRLTGQHATAFVAGVLYGFSPYMVGQASYHLMLSFVPIPPLLCLVAWETLVVQGRRPFRLGLVLAGLSIVQFYLEPEVLALVAITLGLAVVGGTLLDRGMVTMERVSYSAKVLAVAASVTAAGIAYPAWYMTHGPQHFNGPNFPATNPWRSDFFGLVLPTRNELLVPHSAIHFATTTAGGNLTEVGDYVGVLLLGFLIVSVVRFRSNRLLVLTGMVGLATWILSLGPRLVVDTQPTRLPLPFATLAHLPFAQDILPSRFSLPMWLCVAVAAALCVEEWRKFGGRAPTSVPRRGLRRALTVALVVGITVPLLPRWPYPSQSTDTANQIAMDSHAVPDGARVLSYPYPLYPDDQAMLWQATGDMRFKLLGAYIQNPTAQGKPAELPPPLSPVIVQQWLSREQGSTSTIWPPSAKTPSTSDLREFLRTNHVSAVVVERDTPRSSNVAGLLSTAIGPPQVANPEALIWTAVDRRLDD